MASRKCASRYKRSPIPETPVQSPPRDVLDISLAQKETRAVSLAAKKAAATDKRVSVIEKSLSELKDLLVLQFKSSKDTGENNSRNYLPISHVA